MMASQTVNQLFGLAANLRAEGWDLRANTVQNAAERMQRMEELIVSMQEQIKEKEES